MQMTNEEQENNFIIMPEGYFIYNACTDPCDFLVGPCACGAFHTDKYPADREVYEMVKMKEGREMNNQDDDKVSKLITLTLCDSGMHNWHPISGKVCTECGISKLAFFYEGK